MFMFMIIGISGMLPCISFTPSFFRSLTNLEHQWMCVQDLSAAYFHHVFKLLGGRSLPVYISAMVIACYDSLPLVVWRVLGSGILIICTEHAE